MYELDIDRNALEQLRQGIIPWSAVVPREIDPLPYFTGRHIGRPLYGFTLQPNGIWRKAAMPEGYPHHCLHLAHETGYLPKLDGTFEDNRNLLVHELERPPENGIPRDRTTYQARAAAWYRGLTAFPGAYAAALEQIFVPEAPGA